MNSKRWNVCPPNPRKQIALSDGLGVHPIIAQLLINRNVERVEQAQSFLFGDLQNLYDPFLLKDMDRAVERVRLAQKNKEKVLIYGDYDVDGVTSSVVLANLLRSLGIPACHYIPHRMTEGYGLNANIVNHAQNNGVSLIICVDSGINAFAAAEAIATAGIDLIILDHHEPSEGKLPKACAVVNPKRADCSYPFKSLASVGLAFKLAHALLNEIPEDYLDLVTIGTIADVVELRGENRIFVKKGLPRITQTKNHGLQALLQAAKIQDKKFRPYYVGFILGPRLNATGRMGTALDSLQLLLSKDLAEAKVLAQNLEEHNSLRQKTQNDIIEEAIDIVEREVNFKDQQIIVLNKEGWHRGVLGIVASRLVDKYYRPAIVISTDGELGTGSARSIEGFHLFEALQSCSGMLENFGGHKRAAGLTVRSERIAEFKTLINEFARTALSVEQLVPTLDIDAEVPLSSLNLDLIKLVDSLEPYGEGNPPPVFCTRRLTVKSAPLVMGRDTLKFWVTDGKSTLPAVGFGMGRFKDALSVNQQVDLAYCPDIDDYTQEQSIVLKIKDIRDA